MKRILLLSGISLAGVFGLAGATLPIFINDSSLIAPPATLPTINATSFVNRSTFSISTYYTSLPGSGNFGLGTALPYETANTLFYTNEASGYLGATPGFRFLNNRTALRTRRPASWFVNDGTVEGVQYLEIRATNIVNTGSMTSGADGLIRIVGSGVNMNRSTLRTGNSLNTLFGGGFNFGGLNQYLNAVGVSDSYWAVGTNNSLLGNTPAVPLDGATPSFTVPTPSSPQHQVQALLGRRFVTNSSQLPKFHFTGYDAFVYTNRYFGTADLVQVVFAPTQALDNVSLNVRFYRPGTGPADAVVEFSTTNYDLALDAPVTTSFYLVDHLALSNNAVLFRNNAGISRRPSTYELLRTTPFEFSFGTPANSTLTPGLLYNSSYVSNAVAMRYAAYSANISAAGIRNSSIFFNPSLTPFASSTGVTSPTNLPGRVELITDKLDLELARIRSESTIVIKTKDLSSNQVARVDAPFMSFDLGSKQPEMVISNLAPSDVRRVFGSICAWSGLWRNFQVDTNASPATTNEVWFHVMVVDHGLQSIVPVEVYEFRAHATNLVIHDRLNVTRSILLDAKALDVKGGINFPFTSSWATTNVKQLVNFTNSGVISVPGSARYGTDRPAAYSNFVNSGTNTAGAQFIRSRNFENSGSVGANNGLFTLDTATATLAGPLVSLLTNEVTQYFFLNGVLVSNTFTQITTNSPGAKLASVADLQISAGSLAMSNAVLLAGTVSPGRLILSVTNNLVGSGLEAPNTWSCTAGFEMRRRPVTSDLLSTSLRTAVAKGRQAFHVWSGEDRGTNLSGFTNNLALGKLTVDAGDNSTLRFNSASGFQALYVDYLELLNTATNFNTIFRIDPRLTIYFANANVSISKLDGAAGGRFRWVPSFAGPLSSTNITYPSGNTYTFNIALVNSKNIDSDGDGIVNADDDTPILVPGEPVAAPLIPASVGLVAGLRLSVALDDRRPAQAKLTWQPRPRSISTIEFKPDWIVRQWETLTNIVSGDAPRPITIYDPVARDGHMKVYRLRVSPAPAR